MTHKELVEKGKKWLRSQNGKNWNCPVTFGELVAAGAEIPDVMGISSNGTAMIECKRTRADFKKDRKKYARTFQQFGMGNYRFYMCPTDLIKPEEVPEDWGLIYVSEKGRAKLIVKPKWQRTHLKYEHAYMYSIIRRLYNAKNSKEIQTFFRRYA
jgi:hypothetical protein